MYEAFKKKNRSEKIKENENADNIHGMSTSLITLFNECGGFSYNEGLYRIHTSKTSQYWSTIINKYFPQYKGKLIPFGFDWLGRQFAMEANEESYILMFDPSTAKSFKVEEGLVQFHNSTLVDEIEDLLSRDLFDKAINLFGRLNINYDDCIGYKTPLFLGGTYSLDNYEIIDLDVYWETQCQIYLQIKDLPPGTKISSIKYTK